MFFAAADPSQSILTAERTAAQTHNSGMTGTQQPILLGFRRRLSRPILLTAASSGVRWLDEPEEQGAEQ